MKLRDVLFVEIGCVPAALMIVLLSGTMGGTRGLLVGLCFVGGILALVGILVPIVEWTVVNGERWQNKWYLENPRLDPFNVSKRYFSNPKHKKWLERQQAKDQPHD